MKSSLKIFQAAKQAELKSEALRLLLNKSLNEDRYTSINQFILKEDIELLKELVNKPETEGDIKDDLDVFQFMGMLFNYSTGLYEPTILEMSYEESRGFVIAEGEATAMLSRANLRLDKLSKKHIRRMLEHPLQIRRNKCKKK